MRGTAPYPSGVCHLELGEEEGEREEGQEGEEEEEEERWKEEGEEEEEGWKEEEEGEEEEGKTSLVLKREGDRRWLTDQSCGSGGGGGKFAPPQRR